MNRADASHAWVALWCQALGWVEFDPTNLMPSAEHIALAWGRDYGDVSSTTSIIVGGGAHRVEVAVAWSQLQHEYTNSVEVR